MAILAIDKLKNNAKSQITIVGPGIAVTAFLISDFTLSGSNEFQSIFELTGQEDLQKKLLLTKSVADKVGAGGLVPEIRIKSIEQTELTWMSSELPTYSLQLLFLSVRPGDDVRKDVKALLSAVYPVFKAELKTKVMFPPLGYKVRDPNGNEAVAGTLIISIGSWFRATKQVIRSASFTHSKEVVDDGTPLYATGELTFSPYRMISVGDVQGYLR